MAADSLSPIAPARVRVLVVPAGRIKRRRFMTFVERLQQECTIRLGDISPDGRSDNAMFSPMAFPNGALLYHFSTAMPPPTHLALAPFELFREPMMVIGLADAEEYSSDDTPEQRRSEELAGIAGQLREQHPKTLVHQLLIMECVSEHGTEWIPQGAMCVPPAKSSKTTTMKTVMCDISARFLSELGTYAKAVQALPSVQSPGASIANMSALDHVNSRQSIASGVDSPTLGPGLKSPPSDALSRTASPSVGDTAPSSPQVGPATSFDQIASAAMSSAAAKSERDGSRTASRDRMSMQAFTSSSAAEKARNKGKARVGIVIGSMHMMAGRWSDAWRELVENTNKSRIASDYLWYSKGLESILVCMLLFVWTGYDFIIPSICYSGIDRPSSILGTSGIKDTLPSLGTQDPVTAEQSAQKLAKLLPDLVPIIISIYDRANTLAGEVLPPIAYSESIVRLSKLLALVHNANGRLESAMVGRMLRGSTSSTPPRRHAAITSGISKHSIAEILFQAYPPPTAVLPLGDTTKILSGIASVLSMLGLERKKAIVVKDLLAYLVPALVQARKVGAAEMGIHPAASLSAVFDVPVKDQQVGLDGLLKGIHSLYGARVDDGSARSVPTGEDGSLDPEDLINAIISKATESAGSHVFGSMNLKIDILRSCIDFCEALPDLAGIVHFSALLLRVTGPQSAVVPSMPRSRVTLATEEQVRLMSTIVRTINAATKVGINDINVRYWDDFLIRHVRWAESVTTESLREHHKFEMDGHAHPRKRPTTPFLYDPFAKQDKKTEEKILVIDEPAELMVELQNPYDFDVKIDKLSIVTEGVALDVQHPPFMFGPARIQTLPLTVKAKEVGSTKIIGFSIKVLGCIEQVFPIYRDAWSAETPIKIKDLGLRAAEPASLVTVPGSASASQPMKTPKPSLPVPYSLASTVIQAQPHVIVDGTSLPETALMVLEGQRKTFQVTLRNISQTVSVDFIHVSFEDSLTMSVRTALANHELSRSEMYELQTRLSQDPILTYSRSDGSSAQIIAPGKKATFDISIVGKPGLGTAKIMFDYAYLGQPLEQLQGRAYTRQVSMSMDITVNSSIQLHRMDIADFPSSFAWSNQHRQRLDKEASRSSRRSPSRLIDNSSDRFHALLDRVGLDSDNGDHFLILLDVRNAWPSPLSVSIEVRESLNPTSTSSQVNGDGKGEGKGEGEAAEEWKRAYTVHELIHPGHIARLALVLPKIYIADPYAPIPLLAQIQRQFVFSADKIVSPEHERATREQFWFREEVLKHLRGSWKEHSTERQGTVDLRAIRFTTRMIEMLKLPDIDVSMSVTPASTVSNSTGDNEDKSVVKQLSRSSFQVSAQAFLTIVTTITNRSKSSIRAVLRLQPTLAHQHTSSTEVALDVSRKLMVSGLLQQALPLIAPGKSVHVEVGICALVNGEFDIGALVEEIVPVTADEELLELEEQDDGVEASTGSDKGEEDFGIGAQGLRLRERRMWRAGEACRLVVVAKAEH